MDAVPITSVPLTTGDDGVIRVTGTRVTLDSIVASFDTGATPEEIVQQYPSLDLATAYAVIAYSLMQRPEVDEYLQRRGAVGAQVRAENEERFSPDGVRARLAARRRHSA
jgi:uncharacterized protein (DUF433 family)